jgi:hypothetical protein
MVKSKRDGKVSFLGRGSFFVVAAMGIVFSFGATSVALGEKKPTLAEHDENSVWVSRSDGALSCEPGSGQPLEQGVEELRKGKVEVLEARKSTDGKMHIQMCGASEGSTIQVRISKESLPLAKARGFEVVKKSPEKR